MSTEDQNRYTKEAITIFNRIQYLINNSSDYSNEPKPTTDNPHPSFNPPADQVKIDELEQLLQHPLPIEFKTFYSIHNGCSLFCFNNDEIMTIEDIIEQTKTFIDNTRLEVNLTEPEPFPDEEHGISSYLFWPYWIAFTHNGSGDHVCIDMKPSVDNGGIPNQIIQYYHDQDEREYLSTDFFSYFHEILDQNDVPIHL